MLSRPCSMFVHYPEKESTMSTITTERRSAAKRNLTRSALGSLAAAGAVTLALAGTASAADTSNTVALKKAGDTRLTLDKKAGAALKSLGIKVAPVKQSKVAAGAVVFPITSGSVDPKLTDGALINHSGGLRLTKGHTTVALRNFRIRVTGSQATISAAVGTTRATIINLDLAKAKATRPALNLRLKNVGVKLNATGAVRVEQGVQDERLQERSEARHGGRQRPLRAIHRRERRHEAHARPGDARCDHRRRLHARDRGAGHAQRAGGDVPDREVQDRGRPDERRDQPLRRPVAHEVGHHDSATDFDIKLSASPTLAAAINGTLPKADILNLDASNAKQTVAGQTVTLQGVVAKINTTLANALGLPSADGATLGTAVVTATMR